RRGGGGGGGGPAAWVPPAGRGKNTPPAAIESENAATLSIEAQPQRGPSIAASERLPSAAIASACPGRSNRRPCGLLDSGTTVMTTASVTTQKGMIKRKMLRQPDASTSAPPAVGPMTMAMP